MFSNLTSVPSCIDLFGLLRLSLLLFLFIKHHPVSHLRHTLLPLGSASRLYQLVNSFLFRLLLLRPASSFLFVLQIIFLCFGTITNLSAIAPPSQGFWFVIQQGSFNSSSRSAFVDAMARAALIAYGVVLLLISFVCFSNVLPLAPESGGGPAGSAEEPDVVYAVFMFLSFTAGLVFVQFGAALPRVVLVRRRQQADEQGGEKPADGNRKRE